MEPFYVHQSKTSSPAKGGGSASREEGSLREVVLLTGGDGDGKGDGSDTTSADVVAAEETG